MSRTVLTTVLMALVVALATADRSSEEDSQMAHFYQMSKLTQLGREWGLGDPRTGGNRFVASFVGGSMQNGTYAAGQEIRMVVASAYAGFRGNSPNEIRANGHEISQLPVHVKHNDTLANNDAGFLSNILHNTSYARYVPAFNISTPDVRVRVIAGRSSRTATTGLISCVDGANHDIWQETWGIAPRRLAFGRQIVFSGFVTFTAPPFAFRVCVKDTTMMNATRDGTPAHSANTRWMEYENMHGVLLRSAEPVFIWKAPSTAFRAGDYAAIKIVANVQPNSAGDSYATTWWDRLAASNFTASDSVKLVPAGYPCSYEKEDNRITKSVSSSTSRTDQYCGTNVISATTLGWTNANCELEGAPLNGVGRTGSEEYNPFATTSPRVATTNKFEDHLVAYFKLPAAGSYDMCVTTRAVKAMALTRMPLTDVMTSAGSPIYGSSAAPVWIKAYDASSSNCERDGPQDVPEVCMPRKTAVVVSAAASEITWATTDDTPGTWGEIAFTASTGTLNYNPATQWDLSWPQNYYNVSGGDVFRLVPEYYFTEAATATTGNLGESITVVTSQTATTKTTGTTTRATASYPSSGDLTAASTGTFTQAALGDSDYGTKPTVGMGSGCFWQGNDNYGATGHFGNPGASCCSSAPCTSTNWCTLSDSGNLGPSASADLGATPRVDYAPWLSDGTGTQAWGFIRFPAAGSYRVCYKKAGESSWRELSGSSTVHTTANVSFIPRALNAGYQYHFNDSRAETWGPVKVTALAGDTLDKQAWNYYTAPTATAVGSALKMVLSTESCYVSTAQSRTYSMNPGSREMVNTLGSADDSTTLTNMIYFFVKLPAYSTSIKYRICFRPAAQNWHALSDPNYVAHAYMTAANDYAPLPAASLSFTLGDHQTGSWGKLLFNRSGSTTQSFNADISGDLVRLVPNETSMGVEVGCDRVWDSSSTVTDLRFIAQIYSSAMADENVAVQCAGESPTSTDTCYSGTLRPTSNSIVSTTPYIDVSYASDQAGVDLLDGTAAFITLPTGLDGTRPVGYKVCYKQARFENWIEAPGVLTVTTARTVTKAAPSGVAAYAGAYSYVALTASDAAYPINVEFDLVKLVASAQTCDAPVVTNAGYELYTAISGATSAAHRQCLVDATNSSQITASCKTSVETTTARAYMTFPTTRDAADTVTNYRVCYMARSSDVDTQNWHDLGTMAITQHGLTFTTVNRPYQYGATRVKVTSHGHMLDTRSGYDAAKVIAADQACADTTSTDQPSVTTAASSHVGTEIGYSTAGITDVGPSDLWPTREALLDVVFSGTASYKVCYKPYNEAWIEVLQAQGSERVYALADDYITPTATEVSSFTLNTALAGSYTNQPDYNGQAWSTVAIGGASTYDGTTHYLSVTYASANTASLSWSLKFVLAYREQIEGTYDATGKNCMDSGIMYTYTTTATTSDDIDINLPLGRGKYTVCVWSSTSGTWYQAPSSNTFGQPLTIVDSKMAFTAVADTLTIHDLHSQNGTDFGGLAALDDVYIINATGGAAACGSVADYTNTARDTAKVNLTTAAHGSDSSNFLSQRIAAITTPASTRTGAYGVCVRRSQAAATNNSYTPPFVGTGWYLVRNAGATFGPNTDYFVLSGGDSIAVTCPAFNATRRLRTGHTVAVTLAAQDASSNFVDYAAGITRAGVTLTSTGALASAGAECAAGSSATYGQAAGGLTQYMDNGRLKLHFAATGACPSGGCTLSFANDAGLTSTSTCTYDVLPTTVASVRFVDASTTCTMGSWCTFRVVAVHSDGGVAHTINTGVSFTVSGWTASSATTRTVGGANFDINGGSTNFVNGVVEFNVMFTPNGYSTSASETVTLSAAANGQTAPSVSFTVHRPILSGVHIVDVYPVATTGAPLMPLQPTWEPSQTSAPYAFRGGDGLFTGSDAVSAGAGFHLVAGQAYAVVFRAVATTNGATHYAAYQNIVPSGFSVAIDSAFVTTLSAVNNAVLQGSASSEHDQTAISSASWSQSATSLTVSMRFKSGAGCIDGCTIPFSFSGFTSTITGSLTTPVRSIATHLTLNGCAAALADLSSSTATSCTGVSSTVNKGWYANVTAVDDFGVVDRYFDGTVVATLSPAAERMNGPQGIKLTTVAELTAGVAAASYVSATATAGVATLHVTTTKPCAMGCEVQLMSTYGADVSPLGVLVSTPNTARLDAKLNTVLAYCDSTSTTDCVSVAGVSLANATNTMSLIYQDTDVCIDVTAVDANGDATLYETNWIGYYARDTTGDGTTVPLTLTDSAGESGFVQRYKPLVNSMATFCFKISGFADTRLVTVSFIAQRFGTATTYWSHGTTGTTSVGQMRVWPRKLIWRSLLSSVSSGDIVTAGDTASVSDVFSGTAVSSTLTFTLVDHYNNSIAGSSVVSTETAKYMDLSATITNLGDTKIRGDANVTLDSAATSANVTNSGEVTVGVTIDAGCLGCTAQINLVDSTGNQARTMSIWSTWTYQGANVTFYVVDQTASNVRRLAFNPGTSPLTSYWINGSDTAPTANAAPTYFAPSCFSYSQSCNANPAALNLASCDGRGTATSLGSSATAGLMLRVYTMPSATALTTEHEPSDATSQVDIMNTYTVSVSFGNQNLWCLTTYGAACGNDLTSAPTQTLAAYGATVRDAIGNFVGAADAAITTTNFYTVGLSTSSYLAVNSSTSKYDSAPSSGGVFSASATGGASVSGIAMASNDAFYWRPQDPIAVFSLLGPATNADACNETMTYECAGGGGCVGDAGTAQTATVSSLGFSYLSQSIPAGVAVPFTLETHDASGFRVMDAAGSVAVSVDSWAGCNNGGAVTATGSLIAGRATLWVTFGAPCENCVLKFALTLSSSAAQSATLAANVGNLWAYSSKITVVSGAQPAVDIIATAATPATVLTSTQTNLTVADAVTVTLLPRARVGTIPYATTASTSSIAVYPKVPTTASNWWWVGNGGVLRTSLTATDLYSHYQVLLTGVTGETTATVYFTRTCASCNLQVAYSIDSAAAVSFELPTTFVVTTAATLRTLVGMPPRRVDVGKDIAVALWTTGTEDAATIPVAGVAASTTTPAAAAPTFSVTTSTNGNGGSLTATSWAWNQAQVHRISFSAPCDVCEVSVAGNSFPIRVTTLATHLRPGPDATLTPSELAMGTRRPASLVPLRDWRIVPIQALDDMGFVDQSLGDGGCAFPARRFMCSWTGAYPTVALTSDGVAGAFPVAAADFLMADQAGVSVGYSRMQFGAVNYNFSFTLPQRNVIPVWALGVDNSVITSAQTPMHAFPAPKYSVSVGTSNLAISVVSDTADTTQLTQHVSNTFHVALVGTIATVTGKKFVAVEADNLVTLSASAGCPAHVANASGPALMGGYATFDVAFSAALAAGSTCSLTFTIGAGTGSCAATADCTVTLDVVVAELRASRFAITRPTMYDNGVGSSPGAMYAHAGRTMKLRTTVSGATATGAYVPITDCTTCTLTVTSQDCGFTEATATVVAGTSEAEVSLQMQDQQLPSYTCTLTVTMVDAGAATTTALTDSTGQASLSYTVTVCKSASVRLLTNTSDAFRGMMLRTGVAYSFWAILVDANGNQCWGDSQDDATVLSVSAVDGLTDAAISGLQVVNVNSTSTTTAAYAMGDMDAPARTSVTAVGGGFKFALVFTNSSVTMGLANGIKVRIEAAALASVAMSGAFDTVIAASRLAFTRMTFPRYIVKTRAVLTGPMRRTSVGVVAVDGLPDSWYTDGLMSGMPNVARGAMDFGNDAAVEWRVSPTPSRAAAFPLSVAGAGLSTTLSAGHAMWDSVTWNGADGVYGLAVAATTPGIEATPSVMVTSQTLSRMVLSTRNFTTTSAATCESNCILPNASFATLQNASINGGAEYLSIPQLRHFNLTVHLTDGNMPVMGDDDSVIALTLNAGAGTTLAMGLPPSYRVRGMQYARVRGGRATFSLGFIGDTMVAGGSEQFASLTFSCPATRPAELLMPGEAAANPCALTQTVTTRSFQVTSNRPSAAVLNSPIVTAARQVIKARLGVENINVLNFTNLNAILGRALNRRGISYIFEGNINRCLMTTRCTVAGDFPVDGDLGTTVCGPNRICEAPNNLASCPARVLGCGCPQLAARSLLLNRFLLQTGSGSSANGTNTGTRVEIGYELQRLDTFPATTAEEVAAEYTRVQAATIDALRNDAEIVNGFQVLEVGTRSSTAEVTTLPPVTPPPVVNPPPVNPPPPPPADTPTQAPASSASPLAMALALLLAALATLLA